MLTKLRKWWYFHLANPVVRKGGKGGFKWVFRRYWMEISTLSGNFKARFTAAEHPYGYLIAGEGDENVEGFCQMIYMVGMLLTTEQQFVDDVKTAIGEYEKRLLEKNPVVEDEIEEQTALEWEKQVEERSHVPGKYRRRGQDEE